MITKQVSEKLNELLLNKEKVVKAFIVETGFLPSECEIVEWKSPKGETIWKVRKSPFYVDCPEKLYRIGVNGLVDEFYFLSFTQNKSYAVYCNNKGHFPERVYVDAFKTEKEYLGFFVDKSEAIKRSINLLESIKYQNKNRIPI